MCHLLRTGIVTARFIFFPLVRKFHLQSKESHHGQRGSHRLALYVELLKNSAARDADQHLLTITERDLLIAMEGGSTQPARTANDRPDPC